MKLIGICELSPGVKSGVVGPHLDGRYRTPGIGGESTFTQIREIAPLPLPLSTMTTPSSSVKRCGQVNVH
jgi:hypothetical protein